MKRVPSLKFEKVDSITSKDFSPQLAEEIDDYLDQLLEYYQDEFYKANTIKEQFLTANIDADREKFDRIRDNYSNESIEDIVRKVFDKNKILREENHLIQMVDPIYHITMVWVLTILLYVVLYFELLKKGLNFAVGIKWKRKSQSK
jgi:hypothetical protein